VYRILTNDKIGSIKQTQNTVKSKYRMMQINKPH